MPKNILLLLESFSGMGDFTILIKLGKFLRTKGYNVYSTLILPKTSFDLQDFNSVINEEEALYNIVHPLNLRDIITIIGCFIKKSEKIRSWGFHQMLAYYKIGISNEIHNYLRQLDKSGNNFMTLDEFNHILNLLKSQKQIKIDFELCIYESTYHVSGDIKRILIDQYSGDGSIGHNPLKKQCKPDFYIAPAPEKEVDNVLLASIYSHNQYSDLNKKHIINYITENTDIKFIIEHMLNSIWGAYYSSSQPTNMLLFDLLKIATKHIHGRITYFVFGQNTFHNFKRFHKDFGIVDLINNKIIAPFGDKNVLIVILKARQDIFESIINNCEITSMCGGDSSFNVMFNRAITCERFTFFRLFYHQQTLFYRFILNRIYELEDHLKIPHNISWIWFLFSHYEYFRQEFTVEDSIWDEYRILREKVDHRQKLFSIFQKEKDYAEMARLFYDREIQNNFLLVMRNLIPFLKVGKGLCPIEEILLDIIGN